MPINKINKKNISITLAILFVVALVYTALFVVQPISRVGGQSILTPFGGPKKEVSYECCFGHIVTIDDAVSNQEIELMYYPGISQLYSYYIIFMAGPNTVGNYLQIGICLESDEECESVSTTDGTILNFGPSLIGS